MLISELSSLTSVYRVEVSGWDEDEIFFVEKSELAWDEDSGNHIALQHRLAEGSFVFVRLLQSTSYERCCPVAYTVACTGNDASGKYLFRLNPAQPRNQQHCHPLN